MDGDERRDEEGAGDELMMGRDEGRAEGVRGGGARGRGVRDRGATLSQFCPSSAPGGYMELEDLNPCMQVVLCKLMMLGFLVPKGNVSDIEKLLG